VSTRKSIKKFTCKEFGCNKLELNKSIGVNQDRSTNSVALQLMGSVLYELYTALIGTGNQSRSVHVILHDVCIVQKIRLYGKK